MYSKLQALIDNTSYMLHFINKMERTLNHLTQEFKNDNTSV